MYTIMYISEHGNNYCNLIIGYPGRFFTCTNMERVSRRSAVKVAHPDLHVATLAEVHVYIYRTHWRIKEGELASEAKKEAGTRLWSLAKKI